MRVWGGLFLYGSICVFLAGCVPPDSNTNTQSNGVAFTTSNISNANGAVNSNTNLNANVNENTNDNVNAGENVNANANVNSNAPINYAQPVPSGKPVETRTPMLTSAETEIVAVPPLMIPVQGIRAQDLRDTFTDARSEGRSHDAIDIIAPQGAPVLAAADGEIAQFHDSERGGITIYQYSRDKKLIYYYAHLQARAPNLKKGDFVRQGTIIGTVGDTGNSGAGNFHLHFAVWTITDPKRVWEGTNINPYPLLTRAR
jgi:peptidoglycan LD-endopeptidase LytH